MKLQIVSNHLLDDFTASSPEEILPLLKQMELEKTPVDYFAFYNSISTVYSSKIEGENIDYDSYFKHRFLNVEYQPDYTKKADDLYLAYEYIFQHQLTFQHVKTAHSILSANLLPRSQQGKIRNNPMFVINNESRIEYVAAESHIIDPELARLFADIELLLNQPLNEYETFYYASYIHLVFVKIHLFQDGNGRTARLLEKWFLISKLGINATAIQLEKNYFEHLQEYYKNIRLLGLEYPPLDYNKALPFLQMTIKSLISKPES
ncbi:MAG: Fic family protein [Bacteroidetes bacterium]|nr:Fic family protein [Bacteroidota bacterium]